MKRIRCLQQLSRDHHDGLVHARRLVQAADFSAESRAAVAGSFLWFVATELRPHFAQEEHLLTRAVEHSPSEFAEHAECVANEHAALMSAAMHLQQALSNDSDYASLLTSTGTELRDHIRYEEREVFEALQRYIPEVELETLIADASTVRSHISPDSDAMVAPPIANLPSLAAERIGAPWQWSGQSLAVSLFSWEPGHEIAPHVRSGKESVIVCISGSGTITVDESPTVVGPGCCVIAPTGITLSVTAGENGLAFIECTTRKTEMEHDNSTS